MANFDVTSSVFTQTYTSFSGCDIRASFEGITVGNLMGVSFSVTREKAPIYVLGG